MNIQEMKEACGKAGFKGATVDTNPNDKRLFVTVKGKDSEYSSYFHPDKVDEDLPVWLSGLDKDA
jgi:hypothetical protein